MYTKMTYIYKSTLLTDSSFLLLLCFSLLRFYISLLWLDWLRVTEISSVDLLGHGPSDGGSGQSPGTLVLDNA